MPSPKINLPLLLLVSSFVSQAKGDTSLKPTQAIFQKVDPSIEVKLGYFFFTDPNMRKIYNQGGVDVQLSGSYSVWKGLQVYGSFEFLQRSGHSLNAHEKTSIYEIPISIGLKPTLTLNDTVQYYMAFGPRYFYVHQHNDSDYVSKNLHKNGIGFFANTGFNFEPMPHFFIDLFGEYSYARTTFHSSKNYVYGESTQVGGLAFGVGLGYTF